MRPEQHEELAADLEARLEEAIRVFREHHTHPANLALHAVGYAMAARGALRFLSGRFLSGLGHGLVAAGLVIGGHRIEGSDPLATARTLQERWGVG